MASLVKDWTTDGLDDMCAENFLHIWSSYPIPSLSHTLSEFIHEVTRPRIVRSPSRPVHKFIGQKLVWRKTVSQPKSVHASNFMLSPNMLLWFGRVPTTMESLTNGAITLSCISFWRHEGHVTIIFWMLTTACCLVAELGLGSDLAFSVWKAG